MKRINNITLLCLLGVIGAEAMQTNNKIKVSQAAKS
jgi:hypothetical protein